MMQKKGVQTVLFIGIFLVLLAVMVFPGVRTAIGAATASFNVSLTISNNAPTITYVYASSDSPAEGTTKVISIAFNASDVNGVSDIPAANAQVTLSKDAVSRTSSGCSVTSTAGSENSYSCEVTIYYYDEAGAWTINASVFDGASAYALNTAESFTMGTTYSISLGTNMLTFSGSPGEQNVGASNSPQVVNNTGNGAFTGMTVKAYDLVGGASTIGAASFAANTSDSAAGHALVNNSAVTLADSALTVLNTKNIYVYADIPTGISNSTYLSTGSWVISAS